MHVHRQPASRSPVPGQVARPHAPLPNSVLARAAAAGAPAAALQQPRLLRQVLSRKPAPPSADALIATIRKAPVASKAQRAALIKLWMAQMGKLIDDAKGGGGAHEAAVLENERSELAAHKATLEESAVNLKSAGDFRDAVIKLTQAKAQELGVELTHDVVVKAGGSGWFGDDLGHLGDALTGMPAGWNPDDGAPITFSYAQSADGDMTGGVTDKSDITMYSRGMRGGDYKTDCPSLKGLTTHRHSIRHEIGHTVHNRMLTKAQTLFEQLDWHEYVPSMPEHRKGLAKDTGLADAELDAFVAGLTTTRKLHKGRAYLRSAAGLVHSLGKPAELPTGHEFDYAYWSQSEYFAEIYSYLIDAPALMKAKLSDHQLAWWKDNVFGGTLP